MAQRSAPANNSSTAAGDQQDGRQQSAGGDNATKTAFYYLYQRSITSAAKATIRAMTTPMIPTIGDGLGWRR
jgi:hypothetical protein